MNAIRFEFRFAGSEDRWAPSWGETEQQVAYHLASLVGSRCPVPGRYRPGRKPARRQSGRWGMPTGAVIEIRQIGGAS